MNRNSYTIFLLCSELCSDSSAEPFKPSEWNRAERMLLAKGKQPEDILKCSKAELSDIFEVAETDAERIMRLISRESALLRELERCTSLEIGVITRADAEYPSELKKKLKDSCPPIFYYSGELELLKHEALGWVGARDCTVDDVKFIKAALKKTTDKGYGVVSGGARGVDTIAETEAIGNGAFAVEFLAGSMLQRIRSIKNSANSGGLLMLSTAVPEAEFSTGIAMTRNRLIYAQSRAAVVVHSALNTGGTWAGACDNLRHRWSPTLCRDCEYDGNQALIRMGAYPVNERWDGSVPDAYFDIAGREPENAQISMFD